MECSAAAAAPATGNPVAHDSRQNRKKSSSVNIAKDGSLKATIYSSMKERILMNGPIPATFVTKHFGDKTTFGITGEYSRTLSTTSIRRLRTSGTHEVLYQERIYRCFEVYYAASWLSRDGVKGRRNAHSDHIARRAAFR